MELNKVNRRILELCKKEDWTLYRLAKEASIPKSSLCAIIKHNHVPTIASVEKICAAFHMTLSQFFDSEIFSDNSDILLYNKLWNALDDKSKEMVLIYMYGLLKIKIPKEVIEKWNMLN